MERKTTTQRFMPLVINLASMAASIASSAACDQLSEKYEKKNKKFLSKIFKGLGVVSSLTIVISTVSLPFTVGAATQKYNYTPEELDDELNLWTEEEKQKYLEKVKEYNKYNS